MVEQITRNPNLDFQLIHNSQRFNQGLTDGDELTQQLQGTRPDWWWTEKQPRHNVCPGVDRNGKIHSLPLPNLSNFSQQDIIDYFDNTWTLTEVLFSSLQGIQPFYRSPYHHLRHPLIFYYCHPTTLYINKLRVAGIIDSGINAYFEQLFETGVDEMSSHDMSKNQMEWPSIQEVNEYRRKVYQIVLDVITTHPDLASGQGRVRLRLSPT